MKKLIICILIVVGIALVPSALAEVVSTTPITTANFWGSKVMAVAVEYDVPFESQIFPLTSFLAKDIVDSLDTSIGYTIEARKNVRIYTNSEPTMLEEGSNRGNYVIVEFSEDVINGGNKEVGDMVVSYYYTSENGVKSRQDQWTKPNLGTIQQLSNIVAEDGTVQKAMTSPLSMTKDYIHLGGVDEFDLISIPRENTDRPMNIYVRVPKDVDETKKYPTIITLTGQSIREWKIGEEMNTDTVLFNDKHMLVWTETAEYGFEDVITVSVRYLHPTGSPEGIDSYDDVAAAVRYVGPTEKQEKSKSGD